MGFRKESDDHIESFISSSKSGEAASAQYYYETALEITSGSVAGAAAVTNANVPHLQPPSNFSFVVGQNGTDGDVVNDNGTLIEPIGVDNESVFTFMYVVSVGGYVVNLTLLFTICCRQKFRSCILFLLCVNLRISERSNGPLWRYNELNCILWSIIRRIPQALASLTIVAISCDRSQAARILFARPCSSDMTKKILRIWIIAILTTVPRGFLYRFIPDLDTPVPAYQCAPVAVGPHGIGNILYAIFHLISVFLLPMCILISHIYSTVQKIVFLKSRHQSQVNQQNESHDGQNTQLHKKQLQLLRNSCIFAAIFLGCWVPWGVYQQLGDLPKSIVSPEFHRLIWIHFKTVRYLPFTVTAFLPFILVVCTYDANIFGNWSKCCGISDEESQVAAGENYRLNNGVQGANGRGRGVDLLHNRPRPIRLLVNHVHHHQVLNEERENVAEDNGV